MNNTDAAAVRQVLLDAALLVEAGWTQFTGSEEKEGKKYVCLVSALEIARLEAGFGYSVYSQVRSCIINQLNIYCLSYWNDESSRTQEEVFQMLRKVAASVTANQSSH